MKIECDREYIHAMLRDDFLRNSWLDFGLTLEQLNKFPEVDTETREVVEFVFSQILKENYLPTVQTYELPEGFGQYGYFASVYGVDGFYVVTFSDGSVQDGEVFHALESAESRVESEHREFMKEFEADHGRLGESDQSPYNPK